MSDTTIQPNRPRSCACRRGFFLPLIIIALGVIFLLDSLQLAPAHQIFLYFWPAVLVICGLQLLSVRRSGGSRALGLIFVIAGAALALNYAGYWNVHLDTYWPLLLIAFGFVLLFRRAGFGPQRIRAPREFAYAGAPPAAASDATESTVDGIAVLGGYQRRITSQQFAGGHLTAFLGGMQLDLTQAEIAGSEARLDVSALFGGVEVRIPPHWQLELSGQPFLGGFSDETHQTPSAGAKRLLVDGTALFGGVVIKN